MTHMTPIRAGAFLIGALALFSEASALTPVDACSLLTTAEIEAVQGKPVTHVKSSVRQCFYMVATFTKSVSLELARGDAASPAATAAGPREQWNEMFHSDRSRRAEPGVEAEREKESSQPLPVKDLGDEAFWKGNTITGGLYVLKNDIWFRISVGGSEDSSVKIEKASRLARKAIPRL